MGKRGERQRHLDGEIEGQKDRGKKSEHVNKAGC